MSANREKIVLLLWFELSASRQLPAVEVTLLQSLQQSRQTISVPSREAAGMTHTHTHPYVGTRQGRVLVISVVPFITI